MTEKQQGKINSSQKKSISNWTHTEENILAELYSNHSNRYISKVLNKTKGSIDARASLLGLKKSSSHRQLVNRLNNKHKRQAWTEEDVLVLKENYAEKSYSDIGDMIDRTPTAVSQKARQLNLTKYKRKDSKPLN